MAYRVLVDENTSPRVAELLRDRGHDAVHVTAALEAGVSDDRIRARAAEREAVILTHDDDFLVPGGPPEVPILYYADDALGSAEIVARVERLTRYVPDPTDLPPVTHLGSWE